MAVDNCFGVDDGDDDDDDATDVQNTHGQPPFTLPVTRYSQDDNSGKVNHKLEIFSEQGFRARPPIKRSLLERPNSKKTGKKHSKMSILDSDLPPDIFFLVQGEDEESGELR